MHKLFLGIKVWASIRNHHPNTQNYLDLKFGDGFFGFNFWMSIALSTYWTNLLTIEKMKHKTDKSMINSVLNLKHAFNLVFLR